MTDLFKRAAVFTDIHFGLKNNSKIHNDDCDEFVDWFIQTAKDRGCDTGIFTGDWHHNRNHLNIVTMDYSIRALEKLGKAFDNFIFFPGNHDLYLKDSRELQSVMFGRHVPGITIIDKPMTIDNVTLCPWLIGNEWKSIGKKPARYIFGHFELPNFYMNSMVKHPDHGEIDMSNFTLFEYVFSGHFHKRQNQNNIHYIGNAAPHNYADAWDDDRGMMILDWGGTPEYINWSNQPTFRTLPLSKLIDSADTILRPKQHLRVTLDIDISFEEASFIKETFVNDYSLRELILIKDMPNLKDINDLGESITELKSIDEIIAQDLTNFESDVYDKNLLLSIYNDL